MPVDLKEGLTHAYVQQAVHNPSCTVSARHVQLACELLILNAAVAHRVCVHHASKQSSLCTGATLA